MQQRHERRDVVALERRDVLVEELLLAGVDRRSACHGVVAGGQRGAGALQRAVDGRDTRVEQLGDFGRVPAENLAQDQHRALARREMLQGGDERQADRFSGGRDLTGIAIEVEHVGVGDGRHPCVLGEDLGERRLVGRGRRAQIHRRGPPLAPAQLVEADVRGDAVEPRPHGRAAFETVEAPPRPDHRLLHGVVRLEARAQHPVAVAGELAAVLLDIDREGLRAGRHGFAYYGQIRPPRRGTADAVQGYEVGRPGARELIAPMRLCGRNALSERVTTGRTVGVRRRTGQRPVVAGRRGWPVLPRRGCRGWRAPGPRGPSGRRRLVFVPPP